jgi:uncharacterized membrane protein YtjA (UPF0391 family)
LSAGGVGGGGGVVAGALIDELLDESDGGGVGVLGVDGVIGALEAGGGGGGGGASLLQPAASAAVPSIAIKAIVVLIVYPSLGVRTTSRAVRSFSSAAREVRPRTLAIPAPPPHRTPAQRAVGHEATGAAPIATVHRRDAFAGARTLAATRRNALNRRPKWNLLARQVGGTRPASQDDGPAQAERPARSSFKENLMLHYAVVFFIIALIAALFGFGGIAAGAAEIAKVLFFIFIIVAAVTFVLSLLRRS